MADYTSEQAEAGPMNPTRLCVCARSCLLRSGSVAPSCARLLLVLPARTFMRTFMRFPTSANKAPMALDALTAQTPNRATALSCTPLRGHQAPRTASGAAQVRAPRPRPRPSRSARERLSRRVDDETMNSAACRPAPKTAEIRRTLGILPDIAVGNASERSAPSLHEGRATTRRAALCPPLPIIASLKSAANGPPHLWRP